MQTTSIKRFMHAHNLIFVITGIVMVAVGSTAKSHYYPYYTFLDKRYFSVSNMLIVTGSLIFLIGLLGIYGTENEKWDIPMAKTASRRYCVLMILIFIFEVSVSTAGFVLRDETSTYIESTLYAKMKDYGRSDNVRSMWDVIQEEFKCCGVQNYSDWTIVFNNDSLPISCCKLTSSIMGVSAYCSSLQKSVVTIGPTEKPSPNNSQKQDIVNSQNSDFDTTYPNSTTEPYSSGCHSLFSEFIKKYVVNIGAVGISFAILQLGCVVVSIHLARQFKNTYYTTFYI